MGGGGLGGVGPARCGGPLFSKTKRGGSVQRDKVNGPLSACVSVKLTDASGSIRAGDEAPRTGAHVAASRVAALPSVAHAGDGAALVDVCREENRSFLFINAFVRLLTGSQ